MTVSSTLFPELQNSGLPDVLIRDHLERMEPSYFGRYPFPVIQTHIAMIQRLGPDNLVEMMTEQIADEEWFVTVVAFDYMAEMSIISGLFAAGGLSITDGDVYTYAARSSAGSAQDRSPGHRRRRPRPRSLSSPQVDITSPALLTLRKIVDIFHVRAVRGTVPDWEVFEQDLEQALHQLKDRRDEDVRTWINLRVVDYLRHTVSTGSTPLYPVRITVDNTLSPTATRLLIEGQDTPAFLYALSTALALRGVNIVRLGIETQGDEVHDTLVVTDRHGKKITDPIRIHELRFVVTLIKQFTHLLIQAPNPATALNHFNQLIDQILAHVKSGREMEEVFLQLEKQRVIGAMAKLFGTSDFLWEDFLRMQYDNLFPVLQDIDAVGIRKNHDQMERELSDRLSRISSIERKKKVLNQYKDREMFRSDMRQILSNEEIFREFSQELTDLAEVVINAAYRVCGEDLHQKYGRPVMASGEECGFCICALGKFGGSELGWASDIELLFVYTEQGVTDGAHRLHNSEYYERLVRMISDTIVTRRAGIFEIDLRLRPYGDKGALACSSAHFYEYFNERGGALPYERQALIKLRVIGGDVELSHRIEAARDAFVFSSAPLDLTGLSHLRERQNNELVRPGAVNVKYSYGGLIDIEYYVQSLQILHGVDNPDVRSPNTLEALTALHHAGHVPEDDCRSLTEAYIFLRRLINALRIVRGNAKDLVLPDRDSQEFRFLARRLGYGEDTGLDPVEQLHQDVHQYMEWAAQAHRMRFIYKLFD